MDFNSLKGLEEHVNALPIENDDDRGAILAMLKFHHFDNGNITCSPKSITILNAKNSASEYITCQAFAMNYIAINGIGDLRVCGMKQDIILHYQSMYACDVEYSVLIVSNNNADEVDFICVYVNK